jgi:hypothetical protein
LTAAGGHDLVGDQAQPADAGRGPYLRRARQPPIELPPHPIGDGPCGERPLVTP